MRALLLDSESVRLGLEDVAGYNPVHLKTYNSYLLASNGGEPVDRHFEYAVRAPTARLRALGVRYYVSPPGQQPKGLPVVYRDRGTVITRDPEALPLARVVRAGGPAGCRRRSRGASRTASRSARAGLPAGSCSPTPRTPGWHVSVDGHAAHGAHRRLALPRGRRGGRRAPRRLDVPAAHAARRARRQRPHAGAAERRVARVAAGPATTPRGSRWRGMIRRTRSLRLRLEPADSSDVHDIISIIDERAVDPHLAQANLDRLSNRAREGLIGAGCALLAGRRPAARRVSSASPRRPVSARSPACSSACTPAAIAARSSCAS